MSLKTRCHESLDSLDPSQRAIFERAEAASFDLSYPWFDNLIHTATEPSHKIRIYVAEDDERNVVIVPTRFDAAHSKARTLASLVNFYTTVFAPIVANEASLDLLEKALAPLKTDLPKWDIVDLSPLSVEDQSFDALSRALRSIGLLPFKYFCFGNWYLPVEGRSFEEYHRGLSSQLRNTIKRKRKHFFSTGSARLEILKDGMSIDRGISDFVKVYNSSWKVEEPFPEFIPGLIRLCAEKGWLRLGLAYLNDKPIAAQLWIVAHGRAAIFKLAYDQQFASYSAGSILTAHLMQHVLDEDKVIEVDYLKGDEEYKKDWMSNRRERWGIIAYNPATLPGLLGSARQLLGSARRRFFPAGLIEI